MRLQLAQCPCSWGVEQPNAPTNPPWETFLDEAAAAGYRAVELGPLGYLPTDPGRLQAALAERGLGLAAGFVMEPLADRSARAPTLARTRETAALVAAVGGARLVVIDDLSPSRSATAGRSAAASRLGSEGRAVLVDAAQAVARIARDEFGLTAVFHPHAGTYVEFEDEIDALLAATDPDLLGLCIDTGHSMYAGIDPVELFARYADRVAYMHFKDVSRAARDEAVASALTFEQAVDRGIYCPVGAGIVDYPRLLARVAASDFEGWVGVEQDRAPLEPGSTVALDDARAALDRIVAAGAARAVKAHGGWTAR